MADKAASIGEPRCKILKRTTQINTDTAVLKVRSPIWNGLFDDCGTLSPLLFFRYRYYNICVKKMVELLNNAPNRCTMCSRGDEDA